MKGARPQTKRIETDSAALPRLGGRAVLYIGGLHGHVDKLREIAEAHDARLIHHDGGVEDAVQRLDTLLPSVDCVLCPINCISHDACKRAKRACQKHNKPFMPLRTASQSSFRAALLQLSGPTGRDG